MRFRIQTDGEKFRVQTEESTDGCRPDVWWETRGDTHKTEAAAVKWITKNYKRFVWGHGDILERTTAAPKPKWWTI